MVEFSQAMAERGWDFLLFVIAIFIGALIGNLADYQKRRKD